MEVTDLQLQQHEKLVKGARLWVAQSFYGQMLKQMRSSAFKSDLFSGGRGGEAFQGQLDQKLAERMASSHAGDRLVWSLVRKMEGRSRKDALPTRGKTKTYTGADAAAKGKLLDLTDAPTTKPSVAGDK